MVIPVGITYGYEIACGFILVWMLRGPYQVLQGLSLIIIIKSLNPAIAEITYTLGLMGWAAVLIAGLRCFFLLKPRMFRLILPLIIFCSVILVLSIFNSPVIDVSVMKVLSFSWFVLAIFIASLSLSQKEAELFKLWMFSFYILIVLTSVPTYFFPEIGFNRNGLGFQGVLSHPQSFAILLVPFAAWFIAGLVLDKRSLPLWMWIIVIFIMVILYLTQARTSIIALFLSVSVAFFAGMINQSLIVNRSKAMVLSVLASFFLVSAVIMFASLSDEVEQFIYKGGDEENITSAFNASRGQNIIYQWNNFLASPVIGTGFGVYASGLFPKPIVYFWGVPISASVEKGFLPTMILEEIGLIGASFFLLFLYWLAKYVFNNKDIKWIAVFLGCLFINFGEAVFFSINGISQWFWLLIALCIAQSPNKWKRKQLRT